MKKTSVLYILIGLLIASQLYSAIQINHLKSEVRQNQNTMSYLKNHFDNEMSTIYANVDRKMTEYTSLIATCEYHVGVFDLEALTVPITFTIQPKTLTDETRIFLDFDGQQEELKRNLSDFTLTKDFKVEDEIYPTIIVEEDNKQQFEQHNGLKVYCLLEEVFPTITLAFAGSTSKTATQYTMNGSIGIKQHFSGANDYFVDGQYVVTIDNKEVKTYEITDFEDFNLEIQDKYELREGQKLIAKFIYTDKQGITYEQVVLEEMGHTNDASYFSPLLFDQPYTITAPNRRLIYKFDESNFEEIP